MKFNAPLEMHRDGLRQRAAMRRERLLWRAQSGGSSFTKSLRLLELASDIAEAVEQAVDAITNAVLAASGERVLHTDLGEAAMLRLEELREQLQETEAETAYVPLPAFVPETSLPVLRRQLSLLVSRLTVSSRQLAQRTQTKERFGIVAHMLQSNADRLAPRIRAVEEGIEAYSRVWWIGMEVGWENLTQLHLYKLDLETLRAALTEVAIEAEQGARGFEQASAMGRAAFLADVHKVRAALAAENVTLRTEAARLRAEYERLIAERNAIKRDWDAAKQRVQRLLEEIRQIERDLTNLEDQLYALQDRIQSAERTYADARAAHEAARARLDEPFPQCPRNESWRNCTYFRTNDARASPWDRLARSQMLQDENAAAERVQQKSQTLQNLRAERSAVESKLRRHRTRLPGAQNELAHAQTQVSELDPKYDEINAMALRLLLGGGGQIFVDANAQDDAVLRGLVES